MNERYVSVRALVENANKLGIDIVTLLSITPKVYVDTLLVKRAVSLDDIERTGDPTLYEHFMKREVTTEMVNKLLQDNIIGWVYTRDAERYLDQYKFFLKVVIYEEKK